MEEWRGKLFKSKYLPMVRPFSAVPELLRRVHRRGLKVAVASSAKASELEVYLEIACVPELVDVGNRRPRTPSSPSQRLTFSSVALKKLGIAGPDAVAIGDTPYDADAAGKAGIPSIGLLCGGFTRNRAPKERLRCCISRAGCPARLLGASPLRASPTNSPGK